MKQDEALWHDQDFDLSGGFWAAGNPSTSANQNVITDFPLAKIQKHTDKQQQQ